MKKNCLVILGFLMLLFSWSFFSCATGSAIITGTERESIDPDSVKIYSEFPENSEIIAFVAASSDSGWSNQTKYNRAVAALKKQAAKIGANGVVIEFLGAVSNSEHSVTGKAIFVPEEKTESAMEFESEVTEETEAESEEFSEAAESSESENSLENDGF